MKYLFYCEECEIFFEKDFSIEEYLINSEKKAILCPVCKSNFVQRRYDSLNFILKGNGFYKNDNREDNKENPESVW